MYNIHCANGKSKPFLKKNQIFSRFFAFETRLPKHPDAEKNSDFCFGPTLEIDSESVEKAHDADF